MTLVHDFSTTYSQGFLHSASGLCDTVVRASGSSRCVALVVTGSFVGAGVALLMDIVFGMPYSPISLTRFFTSMTVSRPVKRNSSLLYLVEFFLSLETNAIEGRCKYACCLVEKVNEMQTFVLTYLNHCLSLLQRGSVSSVVKPLDLSQLLRRQAILTH